MSAALVLAVGMARSWVAIYSRGLPGPVREARRDEIDSDLWEQRWLADRRGEPPLATAAEMAARTLLGMLSDVTWRVQAGASARPDRSIKMKDSTIVRVGLVVLALPLLLVAANGIGMLLGGGEFESRQEQVLYGFGVAIAPLVAIAGLWLCASQPKLGLTLVLAGVVSICALFYWMLFITVPIGLVIVGFAFFRGRGPRPNQPQPA
ncbi:MAG: hypothetical protein WD379_01410 [Dehalococcoidia bacterium]